MFEELEKEDRTKKDDDFSKSFNIQSPFLSSNSVSPHSSGKGNVGGASSSFLQRNIGLVSVLNILLFLTATYLFIQSTEHNNNSPSRSNSSSSSDLSTSSATIHPQSPRQSNNEIHNNVVSSPISSSSDRSSDSVYANMESLPPCEDPEWCNIPMPTVSYFKFDPPTDERRWKIAQLQAASGEQVLLREVIKAFPSHFDFLDGDITFRRLHYAMDMFIDERRDFTPLTAAGRNKQASRRRIEAKKQGDEEDTTTVASITDVPVDASGGSPVNRQLAEVKITSPKVVNGKLMYPWELEGRHVIPEPYDFRYAERAPVIGIGYTAYLKDDHGYYSGSRVGGAFIDRKTLFKHWRQAKDRLEVPFIGVCSLNENWGFLSTMFPNRTAGWGRCCDQPQDKILYDFLDHEKTLMLVSNQHTNVTHPKLLILPRGIPLTWGNTRILVWDSQRLVLKKHKKNRLLFAAASKWGPRPQILACISQKFTGEEFDGHVKNPPQQRLDREEYYVKLAQARFGVGLPGLGYDTFRYVKCVLHWSIIQLLLIVFSWITEHGN